MAGFISEQRRRSNDQLIERITIVKGDLARQADVDAIVTSVMANLDVSGTLNQSLIEAAGKPFDQFIRDNIHKPRAGDTYVMPGFKLPVAHVIVVVTPVWKDSFDKEDAYLLRCYRHAMEIASNMGLRKIAFAALGTGHHGYPPGRAARLAIKGIMERLHPGFDEVRIVCHNDKILGTFHDRLRKYGPRK